MKHSLTRRVSLGMALAVTVMPAFAAERLTTVDPGEQFNAGQMWAQFLAKAESTEVYAAYELLDAVGYDADSVDPALCVAQADALKLAVVAAPVSLAVRRAAFLCADASGDDATADRELQALAALSRHALSQAGDPATTPPIRVLAPADALALMASTDMKVLYQYYANVRPLRTFPLVSAAWDADAKAERHFVFDYVDSAYAIDRKNPHFGFPSLRVAEAESFVAGGVKGNVLAAQDIAAVQAAMIEDDPKVKLEKLRPAAGLGGIQSAQAWLMLCKKGPPGDCEALIDTLLPMAEMQYALPTVLLAYAHVEGIGMPADEEAGWKLLDAADRRWHQGGAVMHYASLWIALHGEEAMPVPLQQRLARAQAAGYRYAQRLSILRKMDADKPQLDATDLAFLAEPAENSIGTGFSHLADYYASIDKPLEERAWLVKAAEAGSASAQAQYGSSLIFGKDVSRDVTRGERLLFEAAHGGSAWAARYLADRSETAGRYSDAEAWLLAPAQAGDIDAIMELAHLYESERPGVSGKIDRALEIYRSLAQAGKEGANARRQLAQLALDGRGMKKDPVQAREWLQADASKGDHASEAVLGVGYLNGSFGEADEAEGMRWLERALKAKEARAYIDYGAWLYFTKNTPESRVKGISLWAEGDAEGYTTATNNYAWALCTSPYPDIFDARHGSEIALRLGDLETMEPGYLDTVAACHAANGEFKRAIELQTKAAGQLAALEIEPIKSDAQPPGYQRRLALYTAGQRYVQTERGE